MSAVSILIVSYRVRGLLEACLRSVHENGFRGEIEVIVVDNASGDGTVGALAPRFQRVRWIENPENVGFAPAVNQAAAVASGKYFLLLNPDAALLPGAVERLVNFLDAHPEVGVVGPRLLRADGRPYVSVNPFPTAASILLYETRLNRLFPAARPLRPYAARLAGTEPFPVDSVEGSCLLVRREAWEAVGGLDPRYFFGFEETDFAWRLHRAGWGVWFHPASAAVHAHSGSTGGQRRGPLVLLSVALAPIYFMQTHRARSFALLRGPLLAVTLAKWCLASLLGWTERAVAFRGAARALLGLRPPWITPEDRKRWG